MCVTYTYIPHLQLWSIPGSFPVFFSALAILSVYISGSHCVKLPWCQNPSVIGVISLAIRTRKQHCNIETWLVGRVWIEEIFRVATIVICWDLPSKTNDVGWKTTPLGWQPLKDHWSVDHTLSPRGISMYKKCRVCYRRSWPQNLSQHKSSKNRSNPW